MQTERWILRNDLIWFKPNIPPRPEKDRLRLSHEHFFHFVKRPKEGRAKYFYDYEKTEHGHHDVVEYPVRPGLNGHSATFPTAILQPRIRSSCPEHGTVLDPFCGSGAAIECASALGRKGIGFEINLKYLPRGANA
jgi:DNA modification methylase